MARQSHDLIDRPGAPAASKPKLRTLIAQCIMPIMQSLQGQRMLGVFAYHPLTLTLSYLSPVPSSVLTESEPFIPISHLISYIYVICRYHLQGVEFPSFVDCKLYLPISGGGGGSNSIFVCRFCEHFAKKRGWT